MATSVLYVEDEAFFGEILPQQLNAQGFEALLAGNAEEAFRLLDTRAFDVILLDLLLPGLDGFEILKKIKSLSDRKDIPVIIMSNLDTPIDRSKAKELGAVGFMVKASTGPDEIGAAITALLKPAK